MAPQGGPPGTWQLNRIAIALHVGAGAVWVLSSLAVAVTRRGGRWIFAVQLGAALIAIAAGTYLWHALHAGRDGATEHLLAAGTMSAFVGFALQVGVAIPARRAGDGASGSTLEGSGLVLYRLSALFLTLAAIAMLASRLS